MKKIICLLIAILGFNLTTHAQVNIDEKAKEIVVKINENIKAENASLVLDEAQFKKAVAVHKNRLQELKKLRKSTKDKAKLKELQKATNKKYFSQIFKEVLSKEQRLAHNKGKKKQNNN